MCWSSPGLCSWFSSCFSYHYDDDTQHAVSFLFNVLTGLSSRGWMDKSLEFDTDSVYLTQLRCTSANPTASCDGALFPVVCWIVKWNCYFPPYGGKQWLMRTEVLEMCQSCLAERSYAVRHLVSPVFFFYCTFLTLGFTCIINHPLHFFVLSPFFKPLSTPLFCPFFSFCLRPWMTPVDLRAALFLFILQLKPLITLSALVPL